MANLRTCKSEICESCKQGRLDSTYPQLGYLRCLQKAVLCVVVTTNRTVLANTAGERDCLPPTEP